MKGEAVQAASHSQAAPFERTSMQLLNAVKLGWNLGNSLDAPGSETTWGNPKVTPEFLEAVKRAGFDLVRIPVTWAPHVGAAPEFVIDAGWMNRVEEVVGYAEAAGLYVVINLHHDGADGFAEVEWITLNDAKGQVTDENNAAVRARFIAVWKQIAERFRDHGEQLLFESMNEIHDGYGPPDPRYFSIVNDLNQRFVSLVRSSGGNNAQRHLVVPGYNTNIDHTLAGFELPTDSAQNRIIVSVHFYDPYKFALVAEKTTWGRGTPDSDDWGQEDHVVAQFDKLKKKFVDRGVPILLGEYGATHREGFEAYRRYYMEYVTKAAVDRGITPVYWDNGGRGSGGENFALMDRENNGILRPELLQAMLRAATSDYSLTDVAKPESIE